MKGSVNPQNKGLLTISELEWEAAKKLFEKMPDDTHFLPKKEHNLKYSFARAQNIINGEAHTEIYALEVGDALGKGSFGKVRLGQNEKGENVAIKILKGGKKAAEEGELAILKHLNKHLGEVYGEAQRKLDGKKAKNARASEKLYIVMGLKLGQDVFSDITEHRIKGELEALRYAILCAKELQRLHDMRIIHGDIQPANFMANGRGDMLTISAIDYGFSLILPEGQNTIVKARGASSDWSPPEEKNNNIRSFAGDVYSLGYMINDYLGLRHDPEVREIITQMMKNERNERILLPEVISKLEAIYLERKSKNQEVISATSLQEYVEKNFDAYIAQFKISDDVEDAFELRLYPHEFKKVPLNDIIATFNKVAENKKLDISFYKGKGKSSFLLSNTDFKKICKNYDTEKIDKTITNWEKLVMLRMEKVNSNITALEETLKNDKKDMNDIIEAIDKLQIAQSELSSLGNKISEYQFSFIRLSNLPNESKKTASAKASKIQEKCIELEIALKTRTQSAIKAFNADKIKIELEIKNKRAREQLVNKVLNDNNYVNNVSLINEKKASILELTIQLSKLTERLNDQIKKLEDNPLDSNVMQSIKGIETEIDNLTKNIAEVRNTLNAMDLAHIANLLSKVFPDETKLLEEVSGFVNEREKMLAQITELSNKATDIKNKTKQNLNKAQDILKVHTSFNDFIKDLQTHPIQSRYKVTKTGSRSESSFLGFSFQSSRRSFQMELIQDLITNIYNDKILSNEEKAKLMLGLSKQFQIKIKDVHPKSRLLKVMENIEKDIYQTNILAKNQDNTVNDKKWLKFINQLEANKTKSTSYQNELNILKQGLLPGKQKQENPVKPNT